MKKADTPFAKMEDAYLTVFWLFSTCMIVMVVAIGVLFLLAELYFLKLLSYGEIVAQSEIGVYIVAFASLTLLFAAHFSAEWLLKRMAVKRPLEAHLRDYENSQRIVLIVSTIVILLNVYFLKSTGSYYYSLIGLPAVIFLVKNVPSRDKMAKTLKKAQLTKYPKLERSEDAS